jgi:hypothetical protein
MYERQDKNNLEYMKTVNKLFTQAEYLPLECMFSEY